MKRKVKFQEGGTVEESSQRSRQLREMMEKRGREGRRVGLAERARERELARQEAARQAAAERAAAQREVAETSRSPAAYESDRRRNIGPQQGRPDFTTDSEGTTRRGTATGREVVPAREQPPVRPSAGRALTEVATPRQMPLGNTRTPVSGNLAAIAAATGAALAEPLVNYGREVAARRGEEAAARRDLNLLSMRARTADAEGGDIAADAERQRQEATRPAPQPAPRPVARPAPRREMSANRLNELAMGAEPRNAEERVAQARMRGRRTELEERGSAFKKGGMVKPQAAPAKTKTGGAVAKPKNKPMPFKKGGVIKKGRK